jgi:hypothetical protein
MQTQTERVISTVTQEIKPIRVVNPPATDLSVIVAVPDNCANCPDSSCCPFANDKFHGEVGYD